MWLSQICPDEIASQYRYYFFLLLFWEFFIPALADGLPLESLQVSGTLLSILADLNNALVWMVSTRRLISKSSSPCTNPLVTVLRAPIIIIIISDVVYPTSFSLIFFFCHLLIHFLFIYFLFIYLFIPSFFYFPFLW